MDGNCNAQAQYFQIGSHGVCHEFYVTFPAPFTAPWDTIRLVSPCVVRLIFGKKGSLR